MEKESFENQQVASLLNEKFVSIKVDREERPDVDRVYVRLFCNTQLLSLIACFMQWRSKILSPILLLEGRIMEAHVHVGAVVCRISLGWCLVIDL